jgi:hypothetical protein
MSDRVREVLDGSDPQRGKIYCANCRNCRLVRVAAASSNQYHLRVRCIAGKWRKRLGTEKLYKYFTVVRRSIDDCNRYEPMGDSREYLRELRKSLPIRDEAYTY